MFLIKIKKPLLGYMLMDWSNSLVMLSMYTSGDCKLMCSSWPKSNTFLSFKLWIGLFIDLTTGRSGRTGFFNILKYESFVLLLMFCGFLVWQIAIDSCFCLKTIHWILLNF